MISRVLEDFEWAGVWSKEDGFSFLIPEEYNDQSDLPEHGMALIAAMIRLEADAEFRQECIAWLEAKRKKRS